MDKTLYKTSEIELQELVICVQKALENAIAIAKKRSEQTGIPLVNRESNFIKQSDK